MYKKNQRVITDNIKNIFYKYIEFAPTVDQELLISKLTDFIVSNQEREAFLLRGYAGTGKTSMMAALVKTLRALRFRTVLLAPTGRAAKVFSQYAGVSAYTIHKKIYRQKNFKDGEGKFDINKNLHSNTFFIVDESSLLSNQNANDTTFGTGRLLDDLITFVYSAKMCKLILVGDMAQLPPVGMDESPALSVDTIKSYSLSVYECDLKTVVRQSEGSGILWNATSIRELISERIVDYPEFKLDEFKDIEAITGGELIEKLSDAYATYGKEDTIVVCRSNKRANRFNQGIRNTVLCMEEEFSAGDYVMVVKNNYHWLTENDKLDFLANGDIARIKRVKRYEERYGFRFLHAEITLPDYDDMELSCILLLDTLYQETPSLSQENNKKLFHAVAEDYANIRGNAKRWAAVREDPYFNALQVKFAYAVTCHKSQGGQWKAVFIDQGWFTEDMLTVDYLRWLYTAFTRAIDKLYLVNFNKSFIGEED